MKRMIRIADTTLRDGEQAPGFSMNIKEKLEVAKQLERLKVDVIEAGFAAVSDGDMKAVKGVAKQVRSCCVSCLARACRGDIDAAAEALSDAVDPMIHIFIATSPIHMEYKLKKTPEEVLAAISDSVAYAKGLGFKVQFSAEDATRSDREFLRTALKTAIEQGADIINVPDTVGYCTPEEMFELTEDIKKNVVGSSSALLSVHCHNDLGLAVINSIEALRAGADQAECTVNGIGERAGNAALEEIVMNLRTRVDVYGFDSGVDATRIMRASRTLSAATGVKVQPNKAIVGSNAFMHESGIHQHGVMANPATYEIMRPESVGIKQSSITLGKHSGRHALQEYLSEMGFILEQDELDRIFESFKVLADRKKTVTDKDIEALIAEHRTRMTEYYRLQRYVINSGNTISSTAVVRLIYVDGKVFERAALGKGPIEASYKAINKIVGTDAELAEYRIDAVTGGRDALGEVKVRIRVDGRTYSGRGLSTDIIESSISAYISAINNMLSSAQKSGVEQ